MDTKIEDLEGAFNSPLNIGEEDFLYGKGLGKEQDSPSINLEDESFNSDDQILNTAPINPFEQSGYDKTTEFSAGLPSTSSTPAEVVEEKAGPPTTNENILNVQMEPTPVNVNILSAKPEVINSPEVDKTPTNTETTISTSASDQTLKTETNSSTVNETKEKTGGFSKFLEKITESKIGQTLNLPELKEAAIDFAKVTKSEVLGGLPDLNVVKESPSGINQIRESARESIQAIKESSKTQKTMEVVNQAKEMISAKERENILKTSPQTTTETQRTETIERTMPVVAAPPASSTTNVTQNQENQSNQSNVVTQSNQGGSTSSQNDQSVTQQTQYSPAQMTSTLPQTQVGGQPMILSTNEMERRLQRIEFLLMNGIEVTIKQY